MKKVLRIHYLITTTKGRKFEATRWFPSYDCFLCFKEGLFNAFDNDEYFIENDFEILAEMEVEE